MRSRHEEWMGRALQVARDAAGDARGAGRAGGVGDARGARRVGGACDACGGGLAADAGSADVPVGAVVYGPDGTELASGHNQREASWDPTAHAEIVALRGAATALHTWRLAGCTLVVTVEPCTMCAGALVLARVDVLVFGCWEPKTGAVGSLWDVVRDRRLTHRPEVYAGVREQECAALMREFFESRRADPPTSSW